MKSQNKFKFKVVFFSALLLVLIFTQTHRVLANKEAHRHFSLLSPQMWQKDEDTLTPTEGFEHYLFTEDPSIDLLFSKHEGFITSDFKNLKKLEDQIRKGKNTVQSLVSDQPVQLSKFKLQPNKDGGNIISYNTEYEIAGRKFFTYEVLHLHGNQNFQAVLRWKENSSESFIKKGLVAVQNLKTETGAKNEK
jgi:hypothetical protein